ncbi:alkaline phosphatase D family protein [Corynebacterium aquatimens]|uniref:Alkaline phosphatase D n=1 Tax=Corynebacterium aquatimens TaxID=1190508 RepID=A0A931E090_9CORY|nr:alkaline phosphatase D family protein [Corynebacterium aquatimens]MBG6121477.1 alkaline phosphatase D [Corynebacterium aquatimens]WJY65979.1 Phospholipase D precursor [Corynebacterium aquatimens]
MTTQNTSDSSSTGAGHSRRSFLAGSATVAGVAAAGTVVGAAPASAKQSTPIAGGFPMPPAPAPAPYAPFMHGVASGDPVPDSVIIWTRVTVSPEAMPGSGKGAPVDVRWQIATDRSFANVVRSGTYRATAETDHTVKIDPKGLKPQTTYYYRFIWGREVSPVGTTHTAPAFNADIAKYNMAVTSCANYEAGYFTAYDHMAGLMEKGEIDLVVFLGDYIYEYGTGGYAGRSGVSRPHWPAHEIVSLADYRIRYGRYRTDPHLQRAHAAGPWVVVWDDHETANNSWKGGAENHTEGKEGQWKVREDYGQRAYYEWLPVRGVRPSAGGHIYRSYRFGNLLQLTMMDLRTYRDKQPPVIGKLKDDPNRSILGTEQFGWLRRQVESATTRWNVMGNSVMISPMEIVRLPETNQHNQLVNQMFAELSGPGGGLAVNTDIWDGYRSDRAKLLEILSRTKPYNLFLTGDIHSEWANSIQHKGREIGCEMVCTSISSANVDDVLSQTLKTYFPEVNPITDTMTQVIKKVNPWVNHVNFSWHGYGVARLTNHNVTMDFYRVSNIEDPRARVNRALTRTWTPGKGF